jgi:hypothetical protein
MRTVSQALHVDGDARYPSPASEPVLGQPEGALRHAQDRHELVFGRFITPSADRVGQVEARLGSWRRS